MGTVFLGGVAWGGSATGCASKATVPPAVPATRLLVENLTHYEWRVTVAAAAGGESRAVRIQARKAVALDLAGGDYVIEQAVVSGHPGPELSRQVPARLEPGQTYHWRLVTLLSSPAGSTGHDPR